jgi:uncharacterized RDD family membrane protein YckC
MSNSTLPHPRFDTLGPRALAQLVDAASYLPLLWLAWLAAAFAPVDLGGLTEASVACIVVSYRALAHTLCGQTLGKRVLRIRLVHSSEDRTPSPWESLARESPWLLFSFASLSFSAALLFASQPAPPALPAELELAILSLAGIWLAADVFLCLTHPHHRAFHDLVARTTVVRL